MRPLQTPKGSVWFAGVAVGINQLRNTVARICKQAGLDGHRTNHSLRATAATRLYEAGMEEQLVSEITGHRSECVREYKRTTEEMKRQANAVISGCETSVSDIAPKVVRKEPLSANQLPVNITVNVNMVDPTKVQF